MDSPVDSQLKLLEEMKVRVEKLWQELIYAPSEDEKGPLRERYRAAMQAYRRQRLVIGEEPKPRPEEAPHDGPDPFRAQDYREFILAWLRHFQKDGGGTLRAFTDKAGVAPQELARSIKRAKPLAPTVFRRVLKAMDLEPAETSFLEALYRLSEAESQDDRLAAMEELLAFPQYRKANPDEYEAWRYLTHWFYVAIREMSTLAGFRAEASWVSERLRWAVPLAEVRKALKFLETAGFFRTSEDGRVESLLKYMNCVGGVYRMALGQFHREMLELAGDSIRSVPSEQRLLLGHTMAVPKGKFDQASRILEKAIEQIAELGAGESSSDEVYHFEVAAFPLTQVTGKDRS